VTKRGKFIAVHNLHELYAPASIIKIATALAALEILGPEYRFSTGFYLDDRQNLYIKGFGDPFLISEEIGLIAVNLKKRGCTAVRDIYIDDSSYAVSGMTAGAGLSDNPYDAQNSGLAVNFNTVNIRRDRDGMVVSAEEQTPTIPLMAELAEGQKSGTYRISITRAHSNGAAIISRYAGELFRAFLQKENIVVSGVISRRRTPDELQPFYLHRSSKTLKEIIAPLMRYSNNFIANQLFLAAGAARNGYPATWKKGREAMTHFLQNELSLAGNEVKIVEGSGLSPANRVSAYAMIKLLDSFKPFALLLPRKDSKLLKSGTLQGVYSYAGYFMENKRLDSFVLLLNQPANNRDRLLRVLEQLYRKEEPPE
jgi:D-alanyl-D-alanine carboxypeptidase/D-alanyl-D-alanine-endopeptidase (penicillin-binding protein 4)